MDEKILFLCQFAVLSASGHNSQPWLLDIRNEQLNLKLNDKHFVNGFESGLLHVEPMISMGTFIQTFRLAALSFGYSSKITYFPSDDVIAIMTIEKKASGSISYLDAIKSRASNRNPFKNEPISKSVLEAITKISQNYISLKVITNHDDLCKLSDFTFDAMNNIMSVKEYRSELADWVRVNNTKRFDGMPGFTHGVGIVPSYIAAFAIKYLGKNGPQAKKSKELMKQSAAAIIVSKKKDTPRANIELGEVYSSICLEAAQKGISSSALGAAVVDKKTKNKVTKHFKLKDDPIYILRLGYSDIEPPHSPRWPVEKLLEKTD